MGFADDIMRGFVTKEIKAKFPRCDRWDIRPIQYPEHQGFSFQVSRYHRGTNQIAIVFASLEKRPYHEESPVEHADKTGRRISVGHYLLIPKGADITGLPGHIGIFRMSSFGFVDGKLVWLTKKKNGLKSPFREIAET